MDLGLDVACRAGGSGEMGSPMGWDVDGNFGLMKSIDGLGGGIQIEEIKLDLVNRLRR